MTTFPLGKLPPALLLSLFERHGPDDPRVLLGPGVGVDCAVLDFGERALVVKSDPITFTAEDIGWYAVHVNANDVATAGAPPRWFLATLLLPESGTDQSLVEGIFDQIGAACREVGAQLIGGHSEVTAGLNRPIVAGTMIGEVRRESLVTPLGARPGDRLLLTKGIPIEATSILAREFGERLSGLPQEVLAAARDYLRQPGISVVREALAAARAGGVHAMHDPTEGGLASGLWELAQASGVRLEVWRDSIRVPAEARAVCAALGVDPLAAIASGALLLAVAPAAAPAVVQAVEAEGVAIFEIGLVVEGQGVMLVEPQGRRELPWPPRDEIARLFEGA